MMKYTKIGIYGIVTLSLLTGCASPHVVTKPVEHKNEPYVEQQGLTVPNSGVQPTESPLVRAKKAPTPSPTPTPTPEPTTEAPTASSTPTEPTMTPPAETQAPEPAQAAGEAVPATDTNSVKGMIVEGVKAYGWSVQEGECAVKLWTRESNLNPYAKNPSSGAYGIPQSLPAEKMASAGDDWRTNPRTQITWGFDYIKGRYGTPCQALAHSDSSGWY